MKWREREEEKGKAQLLFSKNKEKHTKTPSILKPYFCFLALKVPAVMVSLISSVF